MNVAQASSDKNGAVVADSSASQESSIYEDDVQGAKDGEPEPEPEPMVTQPDGSAPEEQPIPGYIDFLDEDDDQEVAGKRKKLKKLRRGAEEETFSTQETSKRERLEELVDDVIRSEKGQRASARKGNRKAPAQETVPEMPDVVRLMRDIFGDSDDDSILADTRSWSDLDDSDDMSVPNAKQNWQKFVTYQRRILRQTGQQRSPKTRSAEERNALDSSPEEGGESFEYARSESAHRKHARRRGERHSEASHGASHRKNKYTEDEIRSKIQQVMDKMVEACQVDRKANMQKRPATQKLQLLPQFKETLLHVEWQEFLLDANALSVIRDWLKPLPDRTLPSSIIRETLLRCLSNFSHISKFALRDSGIGRIVMFFSKSDAEPIVKDLADKLIMRWMNHSTSEGGDYRSGHEDYRRLTPEQVRIYSQQLSFGRTLQGSNARRGTPRKRTHEQMYAAAPILSSMDYVVQPESTISPELLAKKSRSKSGKNKFLSFSRL